MICAGRDIKKETLALLGENVIFSDLNKVLRFKGFLSVAFIGGGLVYSKYDNQ
jgi:hypothetical protein